MFDGVTGLHVLEIEALRLRVISESASQLIRRFWHSKYCLYERPTQTNGVVQRLVVFDSKNAVAVQTNNEAARRQLKKGGITIRHWDRVCLPICAQVEAGQAGLGLCYGIIQTAGAPSQSLPESTKFQCQKTRFLCYITASKQGQHEDVRPEYHLYLAVITSNADIDVYLPDAYNLPESILEIEMVLSQPLPVLTRSELKSARRKEIAGRSIFTSHFLCHDNCGLKNGASSLLIQSSFPHNGYVIWMLEQGREIPDLRFGQGLMRQFFQAVLAINPNRLHTRKLVRDDPNTQASFVSLSRPKSSIFTHQMCMEAQFKRVSDFRKAQDYQHGTTMVELCQDLKKPNKRCLRNSQMMSNLL
ncbi:hypothetical protein MIR68_000525 [Amoeboaphelidium protococcarum]|nr:hypothetical protein MIR68_000525 [Amoeboaphelidium protococcarum]